MKIYIVSSHSDIKYEQEYSDIDSCFSSKENAVNYIKSSYPKYKYVTFDDTNNQEEYYKNKNKGYDANGYVDWFTIKEYELDLVNR